MQYPEPYGDTFDSLFGVANDYSVVGRYGGAKREKFEFQAQVVNSHKIKRRLVSINLMLTEISIRCAS